MNNACRSSFDDADLLGRYLIGVTPNAAAKTLYAKAMSTIPVEMDAADARLWNIIVRWPFTLTFIDGALALLKPYSSIRRKIYTMLAVLEVSPEYCDYFLPKRCGLFYMVNIAFTGICAVLSAVVGLVIIKLIGVKGR